VKKYLDECLAETDTKTLGCPQGPRHQKEQKPPSHSTKTTPVCAAVMPQGGLIQ
jgi:hypothetical protein